MLFSALRNALRSKHPIKYVISRFLVRLQHEIPCLQHRDGYSLRFFPSRINIAIFFHGPSFYRDEERFVKSLLSPGDVFVDVGCNIGLLSLAAKVAVGADGRCIAFEANPVIAQYARLNSLLNGSSIEVVNAALGSISGLVSISVSEPDDEVFVKANPQSGTNLIVPVMRLDDLLSSISVKLLKIDVEGYELEVLKGAVTLLQSCEFIYLEICDRLSSRFGSSGDDILSFLSALGFSLYIPFYSGDSLRCERVRPGHDFSVLHNYLASRSDMISLPLEP